MHSVRGIEVRPEPIGSEVAKGLILALNAELTARYSLEGSACHFRLDADEVAPGRGAFLVAYVDGKPVACGAIRKLDAETAEIKRMFVRLDSRRLGLARRLLSDLEAEARTLGVKRVVLETGVRQPEALALYSNAGFTRIKTFGDYGDSSLSVFMGKQLEARE